LTIIKILFASLVFMKNIQHIIRIWPKNASLFS